MELPGRYLSGNIVCNRKKGEKFSGFCTKFRLIGENNKISQIELLTNGYKIVILAKASVNIQPKLCKEKRL